MFAHHHVSQVLCLMSLVTIMCHILSFLIWIWIYKLVKLVGGGSVINGSTPSSFSWLILWKNKNYIEKKTHLWKKHFWCSLGASSRLELKREIQNKLYCYTGPLSNIPIKSTNFECAKGKIIVIVIMKLVLMFTLHEDYQIILWGSFMSAFHNYLAVKLFRGYRYMLRWGGRLFLANGIGQSNFLNQH